MVSIGDFSEEGIDELLRLHRNIQFLYLSVLSNRIFGSRVKILATI